MNRPSPLVPSDGGPVNFCVPAGPFPRLAICLTAGKATRASIASGRKDRAEGKPVEMGREGQRDAEGGSRVDPVTWFPWFTLSRLLLFLRLL